MMYRRLFALVVLVMVLVGASAPALAQDDGFPLPDLEPITAENADRVELLATLTGHDTLLDLAWSPDGTELALAGNGGIWIYDAGDFATQARLLDDTAAQSVAYNPDGTLLAVGMQRHGEVRLWNLAEGEYIEIWPDRYDVDHNCCTYEAHTVAFNPSGTILAHIYEIYFGGWLQLWELEAGEVIYVGVGGNAGSIAYSSDGTFLAVGGLHGQVYIYDTATYERLETWGEYVETGFEGYPGRISSVAISPDNTLLASGGDWEHQKTQVWDITTGEELMAFEDRTVVAFSPDGTLLAGGSNLVLLWDTATWTELAVLERATYDLAFNPEGTLLASLSRAGAVQLWGVPSDPNPD